MPVNVKILALANLITQLLLMAMVLIAAYLVKRKQAFGKHCTMMRIAVPLQIASVLGVMLPSMYGYLAKEQPGLWFNIEMLVHHTIGVAVIVLWVYINLVFMRIIKISARQVWAMRLAFISWITALLMGLHLYILIWI